MKISYNSPVVLSLVLGAVGVYLVDHFLISTFTQEWCTLHGPMRWGDPMAYIRWFTYILGHGNLDHLMGNMILILLVGPSLEEKFGHFTFFTMIILTAIITALVQLFIWPNIGLLGASGIAFMFVLLGSFTNVRHGTIPLTFILVAILFLGKEIMNSFGKDGVSQMAHIIGGVCGGFFGFSRMQVAPTPKLEEDVLPLH